jgi:hypothetical protein
MKSLFNDRQTLKAHEVQRFRPRVNDFNGHFNLEDNARGFKMLTMRRPVVKHAFQSVEKNRNPLAEYDSAMAFK